MTSPGRDPLHPSLPRLADALSDISARLGQIGDELRVLQAATPNEASPQPQPAPYLPPPYGWTPFPPVMPPQPTFAPPAPAFTQLPAYPHRPPPWGHQPPMAHRDTTPGPTLWERLGREGAGSRLLAWLGGGVTLAGVVLLLVLAVQRGYIGPLPRVVAGAGLGAALVAIGLVLQRRDASRVGALAVAATGFAVLYLDVVAATAIYDFLPSMAGLLTALAVAAAGVFIAHRWNSETFGVFVTLGCALSAPVLTSGPNALLVGFLLVLQVATAPVQVARRWKGLTLATAVPPIVAVLALTGLGSVDRADSRTVLAMCVVTGLVQLVVAVVTSLRDRGNRVAVGLAASAPVPILLGGLLPSREVGATVLACAAVLFAVVWVLHRARTLPVDDAVALVVGAGAVAAIFEALCLALDGSARTAALLGAATLLAAAGERMRYPGAVVAGTVFGGSGLAEMLAHTAPLELLAHAPRADVATSVVVAAATSGLLLTLAALALARAADRVITDADPAGTRARWIVASLAALYGASSVLLALGFAISPDEAGFRAGHVLVTVSWVVAAIVMLLRRIDSTPFRVAGLSLVGAAIAKLVLFDLASLAGIPRVVAFLGAGLLLLAAGAKYAAMVAQQAQAGGSTYRS